MPKSMGFAGGALWCFRLCPSVTLAEPSSMRPGADFILGLLVCVFSWALSMGLGGRQACCIGRHGVLPWTK